MGDLVQIKTGSGLVYHTMVVTQVGGEDVQLSYHTPVDYLDEPLEKVRSRVKTGDRFVYWRISDTKTEFHSV